MERLLGVKCKTLEKSRNLGEGLEKQGGKEKGKEEESTWKNCTGVWRSDSSLMLWLCEIRKARPLDLIFPSSKRRSWTSSSPRSLWALPKVVHWLLPTARPLLSCSFPIITVPFACENQVTSKRDTATLKKKKKNLLYNNAKQNLQIKAILYSYLFQVLYTCSISDRRTWTTRPQKCWTPSGY